MTAAELRRTVRAVRYRRGWDIGYELIEGRALLYVVAPSPRDPYSRRGRRFPNPTWMTPWLRLDRLVERSVVERIWRMIRKLELHEAGEFFRYRGARPHDPHRPTSETLYVDGPHYDEALP